VKQNLLVFLLLLIAVQAFSQTRSDTLVYVLDIEGGTAEERRFFANNLRKEIPVSGYTLTSNILEADYAMSCFITDDQEGGRLLVCSLLDAKNEKELVSTTLRYNTVEEAYELLPYIVWSVLSNAPLKRSSPGKGLVEIENQAPLRVEIVRGGESPLVPAQIDPAPEAPQQSDSATGWKRRRIFLNVRAGPSMRYYLAGNDTTPTTSIVTFEAGLESELHFFSFLALQLGLNFSLDQAEYRHSPSNPTPVVYPTSLLSAPLMARFIFNPSPQTALGTYLGAYATFPLLGDSRPPPLGLLGGLDLTVKTSLGPLLFDLRYSLDLGDTTVEDSSIVYRRMFLTLSVGYKFGFLKR
jgi:hypothetical protein